MPTQTIPVSRINIPLKNRETIDQAELKSLAATMDSHSLLSAITVRPVGYGAATSKNGQFDLVAGERRLRAAMEVLGWKEIECNVLDVDDERAA